MLAGKEYKVVFRYFFIPNFLYFFFLIDFQESFVFILLFEYFLKLIFRKTKKLRKKIVK